MSTSSGTVRVRDFLAAIHQDCSGVLELRLKVAANVRPVFIDLGDTAALASCVEGNRDADIWFGVATRRDRSGGTLANCQHLGALFVDLDCHADTGGLAAALQRIAVFPLSPSIVVQSGGGFHCYWLLREPADVQSEQSAIYALLRRLRVAVDGDPAAAEPARVLRLPGTWNHKYTPRRPVTIRTFEPNRRYNLQEFDSILPEDCGTSVPVAVDLSQPILEGQGRNDAVYRHGRSLKLKGAPQAEVAASMRTLNKSFCQPPMDSSELDRLVANVMTQPDRLTPGAGHAQPSALTSRPVLTRLADVEPETIDYLWAARLARGRLNLLIGDPGLGKSFVALDIAARVTRGREWPDGGYAPLGNVLVLSAEDHAADTIRPRADALGADVTRIHVLSAIRAQGASADQDQPFSLVTDLAQLDAAISETGAVLVTIDPVSAYLGSKIDTYKDAHVRSVLGPLAALAERRHVAVLGIMHLTKGVDQRALYRAMGSVAFVAQARLVFAVAPHPSDDTQRVLVPVKSNICAAAAALAYSVSTGVLTWSREPVSGVTADRLLAGRTGDRPARQDAADWLKMVLEGGPVLVTILQREAKAAGMAWRSVERAKSQLGVDAVRTGGLGSAGSWCWMLRPTASVLRLIPKTAEAADMAALGTQPENGPDSPRPDAKTASSEPVAALSTSPENSSQFVGLDAKTATVERVAALGGEPENRSPVKGANAADEASGDAASVAQVFVTQPSPSDCDDDEEVTDGERF